MESQYNLIYSKEYIKELTSIYRYISIQLKEENIARKIIKRIQNEISKLRYFPKMNKLMSRNKEDNLYHDDFDKYKQLINNYIKPIYNLLVNSEYYDYYYLVYKSFNFDLTSYE